jgi:lactoylglutathione lyase
MRMPGGTDVFLEILEYRNIERVAVDTRTGNPGTAHIAFFVDDCDALYEQLVAKGVRSVSAPVTPTIGPNTGGRAVYMIDPDGIRVELITTKRAFGEFSQAEAAQVSGSREH